MTLAAAVAAAPAERLGDVLGALVRLSLTVRALGVPAGIALALAGVVALALADRLRRPAAALGCAAAGALAALAARGALAANLGMTSSVTAAGLAALIGGAAGGVAPVAFPALAGGLAGALAGVHLPLGGSAALGGVAGGLVMAALGLLFARALAAVLWAAAGGLLLGLGLLAAAGPRPLAAELAGRPFALLAFAVVTAVAGAAYQLSRAPSPPRGGADALRRTVV